MCIMSGKKVIYRVRMSALSVCAVCMLISWVRFSDLRHEYTGKSATDCFTDGMLATVAAVHGCGYNSVLGPSSDFYPYITQRMMEMLYPVNYIPDGLDGELPAGSVCLLLLHMELNKDYVDVASNGVFRLVRIVE